MPPGFHLELRSSNGDLAVEGARGSVEART